MPETDQLSAAEFGNTDPAYAQYTFVTTTPSNDRLTIRGLELEYTQHLSFLPGVLSGLNARLSYTRNYASVITANMSPHGVNGGIGWTFRRLSIYASAAWRDYVPLNSANTSFNRQRMPLDVGGSIRIARRVDLFFTGRNIRSEPVVTLQRNGNSAALPTTFEVTGAIWTLGLKGAW